MKTATFHGHAWGKNSLSVHVGLNAAGEIKFATYNASDRTGDHPTDKAPAAIAQAVADLKTRAYLDADTKRTYALARRHDTENDQLEYCFLAYVSHNTHVFYTDESPDITSTVSGYRITEAELAEIHRLKIPLIDARTVDDDTRASLVISGPMHPTKPDRGDAGALCSLSYAPLKTYLAMWKAAGATIHHFDTEGADLSNLSDRVRHILATAEPVPA